MISENLQLQNFPGEMGKSQLVPARSGPEPGLGPARSGPKVVSRATVNYSQKRFTNDDCQIAAPHKTGCFMVRWRGKFRKIYRNEWSERRGCQGGALHSGIPSARHTASNPKYSPRVAHAPTRHRPMAWRGAVVVPLPPCGEAPHCLPTAPFTAPSLLCVRHRV